MVEQYRPVVGMSLLEIPSGRVQKGELPEETAIRETREETGYAVSHLVMIGSFFSSVGLTTERFYLYVTSEAVRVGTGEEDISASWIPLTQAIEMTREGKIIDAKSALAISLVLNLWPLNPTETWPVLPWNQRYQRLILKNKYWRPGLDGCLSRGMGSVCFIPRGFRPSS